MDMENKPGPWSAKEKKYIADNCATLDYKDIARDLRRNERAVKKYIRENHRSALVQRAKIAEYDIQNTPIWYDLENQFSNKELAMFLHHWGRIVSQFEDDVYPTEELQIVDTIKMELLMNRTVTQQQKILEELNQFETQLDEEKKLPAPDVAVINNLERQIGVLRATQESLNKTFLDLLKEKNNILKSMKATRDARIKQLEQNKNNFLSLMRKIVQDRKFRADLGIEMEKMRLATQVEYQRLSEWYEYDDGEVDQPLLTPENVLTE